MTSLFVTGCGRGIGLELVRQAVELGWDVAGSVRDPGTADRLRERFPDRFRALVFDVTDAEAVEAAAAGHDAPLDVLINNAGVIGPARQSTLDIDFGGFADALAINTIAPLRVAQAFLPNLRQSPQPRIVTVSSKMGSMSYAKSDRIAYRASKAAVNKVMRGLATDLEEEGIAVRLVHPGWVRTDMGGPGADISPAESAAGILGVVQNTTMAETGTFVNWDGTAVPVVTRQELDAMTIPEINPSKRLEATVDGLFMATGEDFVTAPVDRLDLTWDGIPGDFHAGITRKSGSREPWYERGTEMRNERQITILSRPELDETAAEMGIEAIEPEWIGANITLSGVPMLSMLPASTLLFFEGGATLKVDFQNGPCKIAGASVARHAGRPDDAGLALAFVPAAKRRRGVLAWVEKPGTVEMGAKVRLQLPEQWIYPG